MKQRIAEDTEYPPHNLKEMRQRALEHKHDAMAAFTGVAALKAILGARTKAEQIALMRHYVLEFGQSASRNAKLSSSLADDDPEKEKADQSGLSGTFVVSLLNSILSEVAPAPAYAPSGFAAHPSMAGRLGQVLSWTANLIALAVIVMSFVIAQVSGIKDAGASIVVIGIVIAVLIWGAGRALRYVLAGS
jgi:hypothetical protein